jgi:mRNA-degrading endonuclease RelE of RelBE toxin-antitoxin system
MSIRSILYSSKFAREYRKLPPKIKRAAEQKEGMFRKDPFNKALHTHKLQGGLKGFYSFSINQKYRIVFEFADNTTVWFHSVGDHSIYTLFD